MSRQGLSRSFWKCLGFEFFTLESQFGLVYVHGGIWEEDFMSLCPLCVT